MKYQNLENFVSLPRLNRYLVASNHSKTKAQQLYKANLRLAQSFYPILNLFETFLRNKIHSQLSLHFADTEWIVNQKTGFMSHHSLGSSFYLRGEVEKAERKIRRSGTISAGRVIAEQSFGFWTSLFDHKHYGLLRGSIIHCFPSKPSFVNRLYIFNNLMLIKDLRNRIYHNEPICFRGNVIDVTLAINAKVAIYEFLTWIHPNLKGYVKYFDAVDSKIKQVQVL